MASVGWSSKYFLKKSVQKSVKEDIPIPYHLHPYASIFEVETRIAVVVTIDGGMMVAHFRPEGAKVKRDA
jgi:hypothetical protein